MGPTEHVRVGAHDIGNVYNLPIYRVISMLTPIFRFNGSFIIILIFRIFSLLHFQILELFLLLKVCSGGDTNLCSSNENSSPLFYCKLFS